MCGCATPSTTQTPAAVSGHVFSVPDMSCSHCVGTISKALEQELPGTAFSIDLGQHLVTVAGDKEAALSAIRDAGYEPVAFAG